LTNKDKTREYRIEPNAVTRESLQQLRALARHLDEGRKTVLRKTVITTPVAHEMDPETGQVITYGQAGVYNQTLLEELGASSGANPYEAAAARRVLAAPKILKRR
jgi:hypothetical protein